MVDVEWKLVISNPRSTDKWDDIAIVTQNCLRATGFGSFVFNGASSWCGCGTRAGTTSPIVILVYFMAHGCVGCHAKNDEELVQMCNSVLHKQFLLLWLSGVLAAVAAVMVVEVVFDGESLARLSRV